MIVHMESTSCLFCDHPGEFAFEADGWVARQCPECRLVFVSPRPSQQEVADLYASDAAHGSATMHVGHFGSASGRLSNQATLKRIGAAQPFGGRFLEIGPGGGAMLSLARANGYEVAGVEPNPSQAQFIRDNLGVPCWDSLESVDDLYDVIYHCDVLSHFFDPIDAFQRIHALLNPSGLHVFETGDGDIAPRLRRLIPDFQFPDHLYFFTDESLGRLLTRSNFETLAIHRFSLVPQLQLERILRPLKHSSAGQAMVHAGAKSGTPRTARRLVSSILEPIRHAARYGLGRWAPVKGRPQTVVVMARKM